MIHTMNMLLSPFATAAHRQKWFFMLEIHSASFLQPRLVDAARRSFARFFAACHTSSEYLRSGSSSTVKKRISDCAVGTWCSHIRL